MALPTCSAYEMASPAVEASSSWQAGGAKKRSEAKRVQKERQLLRLSRE
jgi:hypothetical protein